MGKNVLHWFLVEYFYFETQSFVIKSACFIMKARCVLCTMMKNTCVDVSSLKVWRLHIKKDFDPIKENNKNNKIVKL